MLKVEIVINWEFKGVCEMENQIEFYIPKNVSTRFEIIKGVGIREIIYTGVATIIGIYKDSHTLIADIARENNI